MIHIASNSIRCDDSPHSARLIDVQNGYEQWECSWLPDRVLTRNQAITAVTIAERVGRGIEIGDKLWPFLDAWAAELELSGPGAVALASLQPGGIDPVTGAKWV
jgi:hypothetical protein